MHQTITIAASVINGLALNAHQLAQLLSKLFPELSRFIENRNDFDQNSPSMYYAEAIDLHEKYKIEQTEQMAQDTIKAYYEVHNIILTIVPCLLLT